LKTEINFHQLFIPVQPFAFSSELLKAWENPRVHLYLNLGGGYYEIYLNATYKQ